MEAILSARPSNRVQGFLAAGHVCAVMGYEEYEPLAERYRMPIVVTGFEPLDLLQGIHMAVEALEEGRWGVENQYAARSPRGQRDRPSELMGRGVRGRATGQWRGHRRDPAAAASRCARTFAALRRRAALPERRA